MILICNIFVELKDLKSPKCQEIFIGGNFDIQSLRVNKGGTVQLILQFNAYNFISFSCKLSL